MAGGKSDTSVAEIDATAGGERDTSVAAIDATAAGEGEMPIAATVAAAVATDDAPTGKLSWASRSATAFVSRVVAAPPLVAWACVK